eukprot:TRINITY_DN7087_c1_g1_i1.p1 TRINITY_DN7087_c1_g1~~TRINITY_DN7087_c1_g1_i1.p1  ORF type:complete len:224 (+),score=33.20 TRINITY_DN7087_c1_g1_i1:112-783(+)
MEKAVKSRSSFFSFIPKNAAFSFSNPPDNSSKLKHNHGRGFSGPLFSIVPVEERRQTKNGSFGPQEPTSPKVSCIGQIKHKKKLCSKSKRISPPRKAEKKPSFAFRNIFKGAKKSDRKSELEAGEPSIPPSLGNLRKFSSGRNAFADFDWKGGRGGAVAPAHRSYYSDEEIDYSDDEDEVVIPHSAPMAVGGGFASGPHKEVNLWKRRTMAPPKALQLNGKDK